MRHRITSYLLCIAMLTLGFFIDCGRADRGEPPEPEVDLQALGEARQQKVAEAQVALKNAYAAANRDDKSLAEAHGRLGMLFQAYRFPKAAVFHYQLATRLDPDNFVWPYYLARVYMSQTLYEEAQNQFLKAHSINKRYVPILIDLAEYQRKQNRLDEAESLFEQARKLEPDCVSALVGLGQIANMREDFDRAIELMQTALKYQPQAAMVHYIAGVAHRSKGDLEKAKHHMALREKAEKEVALADPFMAQIYRIAADDRIQYEAGLNAMAQGDFEGALAFFEKAVASAPSEPEYHLKLGWCLLKTGQKERALQAYQTALPARPGNPDIHFNIAGLLLETGKEEEALTHFRQVVSLKADYRPAYRFLADLERRAGQFEQALTHYETMARNEPSNPEARLGRALMLIRLHQYAEARAALEKDLKDFPNQPAFLQAMARVLAASPSATVRDGDRSVKILLPLAKGLIDPALAETFAMAYAEQGKFKTAIQWQERALALAREYSETDRFPQLEKMLNEYRAGKAPRQPWPDDAPIFFVLTYGR